MNTYYKILNEIAASFDMDQWGLENNFFKDSMKNYTTYCEIYIPGKEEEYQPWKNLIIDICNKLYKNKKINKLINTNIPLVYNIVHNSNISTVEIIETSVSSTSIDWKRMPTIIKNSIRFKLLKDNKINPDIDFNALENLYPNILNDQKTTYYKDKSILRYVNFIFNVYHKPQDYGQSILNTIISELNLFSLDNIITKPNTLDNSKISIMNWCITTNNEPVLLILTNNTWESFNNPQKEVWKLIVAIPWLFI